MLEHLHIKNVALIEESHIAFGKGLNILTGETGAGKSMLIDSLQFALGGRVGKDFLRKGQKMATVEAFFSVKDALLFEKLADNGIEIQEDNAVLITRTLNDSGKSVCRINGAMVTTGMLKELAAGLIDIYGQHEHQSLLNAAGHIRLLDRFCPEEFAKTAEEYSLSFSCCKELEEKLEALMGDESQREQQLDILRFQKEELEEAGLKPLEEDALFEERKRLSHMEKLIRLMAESSVLLYDGADHLPSVCDQMGAALGKLGESVGIDSALSEFHQELEELYTRLEDVSRQVKKYAESLEDDPLALEKIEERLQTIYKMKRKYGGSVEAALAFYDTVLERLDFLSNSSALAKELEEAMAKEKRNLAMAGERLSTLRKMTAEWLKEEVTKSLWDMEMKSAEFSVSFTEREEWTANGKDKIEFLISANKGESLKPLAKIASGGEMSRVMLALKSVLVDADEIETFIFDEIDSGVSGRTAVKVGEKMSVIGQKRQVLCITHLPQIAAMADEHFLIEKETIGEKTITKVHPLEEEGSLREVARLMGSTVITEVTLAAARELQQGRKR